MQFRTDALRFPNFTQSHPHSLNLIPINFDPFSRTRIESDLLSLTILLASLGLVQNHSDPCRFAQIGSATSGGRTFSQSRADPPTQEGKENDTRGKEGKGKKA